MRDLNDIRSNRKFQSSRIADDGGSGWVTIKGNVFYVIYSFGGGWDHVSVSTRTRCPTWAEMCAVKDLFFRPDECCVEYHPAEADYVNRHPYCLHIWKPQNEALPKPPRVFV